MSVDIWQRVLRRIEKKVNRQSFETWFKPTRLQTSDRGILTVQVPNSLFLEWISNNYREVIDEVTRSLTPPVTKVSFVCAGTQAHRRGSPSPRRPSDPLAGRRRDRPSSLNRRYTFETFVVSSCNAFAHAAARSVAEKPSHSYNPLYIYGGVGLGKTHILHAIGNRLDRQHPEACLLYITAENFMNELINCIRFEKTIEFKDKYRNADVLLIDDVQFLEGKERTQEEFFHTFNQLYEMQKQIVLTSDCPPREIATLEERLRSRFEWGLIADIQPPDLETKIAILRKKAAMEGHDLPPDVALYVASKVKSNIRELEGCLVRLIAYSSLTGRPISVELAAETLKDILSEARQAITIESIQRLVADYYRIKAADLRSRNNSKVVALPRHVAMYLCRELIQTSFPEIGRKFGGKHHSTVLHAVRKIDLMRREKPDFDKQISSLMESFQ
ncbi:MAG: chromosomal replication initiator protein DnaA [Acidobacteriota bacterium]